MISARTISIFALLLTIACVEPYSPPSQGGNTNLLVVDGFLNGSSNSANIVLTRAIPLSESTPNPPELHAIVTIENQHGETFSLAEVSPGVYEADHLTLDETLDYRLKIKTTDGSSYTSDYVVMRRSPSLDSVVWRVEPTGVRFYVNGHDASNSTTFYRYLYTDIWEYNVQYFSYFKKAGGPVLRDLATEQVYSCWKSSINTQILTVSTKTLGRDEVNMLPINFIRKGSRELSHIYSILVQQRAISQEEYEYWELIKKTTENLGGLFDPLPSVVTGNIHNDNDATERVLGYFSAGIVQEQRIFLENYDLPATFLLVDPWDFICATQEIPYEEPDRVGENVFIGTNGTPPTAWIIAPPNCADCTTLGGVNRKPPFWPR